jgi:RNA polymerase sigma-70 factor (ECF subfamily)
MQTVTSGDALGADTRAPDAGFSAAIIVKTVHAVIFMSPFRRQKGTKTGKERKNIFAVQVAYNGSHPESFMSATQPSETTGLLRAWAEGDRTALDRLTPRVYRELRRIAGHFMRNENPGRSIQATALVHEAYLKLIDVDNVAWEHRAHFFAVASQVMRRILLDAARKRGRAKRGGNAPRVNLEEIADIGSGQSSQLIALDEALCRLAEIDPRKARVIELRFFGGLSVEEAAVVLKVSPDTVTRDWKLARAWLLAELST